ncbi:MAG: hypothetical protein BWY03_00189 [Parcubacteria group bacterium ADurb.Bin159]|nr:MAG: hypothetical protein BWY03_00189 [Parcubacteria group bacterium ADurb.Bin159]
MINLLSGQLKKEEGEEKEKIKKDKSKFFSFKKNEIKEPPEEEKKFETREWEERVKREEKERIEKEREERERIEREKTERERAEKERAEQVKREREERERIEKEKAEKERAEKIKREKEEKERVERERAERERIEREKAERERAKREKKEKKKGEKKKTEKKEEPVFRAPSEMVEKSEIPEVSLMPKEIIAIPRLVRERIFIFIAGLIIIIFLFLMVHSYIHWHFEALASEVQIRQGDLSILEAKAQNLLPQRNELMQLEKKAMKVDELLENHIYWTKLFHFLEIYTLPDVAWSDFSTDTNGKLQLHGQAKDLPTVARQLVVFSQAADFIKNFSISSVGIGETAEFTIDLELVEGVFKK